jgi:hypothetical protein
VKGHAVHGQGSQGDLAAEVVGLGLKWRDGIGGSVFLTPDVVETDIAAVDFNNTTVVVQNAKFDILVLKQKVGIVPKYIIR